VRIAVPGLPRDSGSGLQKSFSKCQVCQQLRQEEADSADLAPGSARLQTWPPGSVSLQTWPPVAGARGVASTRSARGSATWSRCAPT